MTNFETGTMIFSAIALIVSIITCYLTLLSRFGGMVYSRKRAILYRVEDNACLVLECEFVNEGAKPGAIEDLVIEIIHEETGNRNIFVPILIKDQFNVFQNYQPSDFSTFSGISLGAKQRRELFVVFQPNQPGFHPTTGILILKMGTCIDIKKKKWTKPQPEMSLDISENIASNWNDPGGSTTQVSAIEIKQSRQKYLTGRN
jgi:hypothetical protein